MAVDKWAYDPEHCDGFPCCGDCDLCTEAEREDFDLDEIMEEVRSW
jgi:hypothetical protein